MKKRLFCLLSAVLLLGILAGCTAPVDTPNPSDTIHDTPSRPAGDISDQTGNDSVPFTERELQLPITTNGEHFEIFRNTIYGQTQWGYEDINDIPGYRVAKERTGVTIDWTTVSDFATQFPLMIASGDWADSVLCYQWELPMSVGAYIDGDIMMDLTDIITEYCPNYMRARTEDEDIARRTMSDDGQLQAFYTIKKYHDQPIMQPSWLGLTTRLDWYNEFGQELDTFDKFHDYLVYIKETYNPQIPYAMDANGLSTFLLTGFDVNSEWIVVDGEVRWSPVTEDFRDYVVTMRQWYGEGLFEKNFYGESRWPASMYDEIVGGQMGVFSTLYDMYGTTEAMSDDPDFTLVGLPSPLREGADTRKVAYAGCPGHRMEDGTSAIFTTCEKPEILAQFLDFFYSDEGSLLANYGVEGLSYIMVDGVPEFTDAVTDAPDGVSARMAWNQYTAENMTRIYDWGRDLNKTMSESGYQAMEAWDSNWVDLYSYPTVTRTTEESELYGETMPDIETFFNENVIKYIAGIEDMATYDDYVQKMWDMGLQNAVDVQQTAYERFMARGK